jgi:hypothetical protein
LFVSSPSRNVCPGRAVAEWPTAQRTKHEGYWSAGIAAFWKIIVRFFDKTAPFRTEGRLPLSASAGHIDRDYPARLPKAWLSCGGGSGAVQARALEIPSVHFHPARLRA